MTILAALNKAYGRMKDAAPFGYSQEKIGFCVILNSDGSLADITDLRASDKRRSPRSVVVPACPKRSGTIPRPNFLWDNINYALGAGKLSDETDKRFDAFRDKHLTYLSGLNDPDLKAFCAFLRKWDPSELTKYFSADNFPTQGIVFANSGSHRDRFLHQNGEAQSFWERNRYLWIEVDGKSTTPAICLVTGELSEIARTHPPIKGMSGVGGKSEMALISFNDDAYESYGHKQGDNAPVSEAAAFAYASALNLYLERESGHRIQIGDASTVFWADASDAETEQLAEDIFSAGIGGVNEEDQSKLVGACLTRIRSGEPLADIAPKLERGVRFHVLGLAPNAARLSVRYWFDNDFGVLEENFRRYFSDMEIAPPPREVFPGMWRYLAETAVLGKYGNVPPNLAGEWLRSILTGARYPQTLLATVLMRTRSDKTLNALRAQMLKAVLIRNYNREVPVAFDPDNRNKGYVLGRLFAVYEQVQTAALGSKVNATIKDKFYGAASAQPRKVFALLDKGSANHLSKVGKQSPGWRVNLERNIASIMDIMEPVEDPFPSSLSAQEQALFAVGYYHQRSEFFKPKQAQDTESEGDE